MKNKKIRHKKTAIILAVLPILSTLICWAFQLNFLVSTLVFFGVPSAYLSLLKRSAVRRASLFSAVFSVVGIYTDYLAERDLAWAEPHSLFSFRVGGVVPIESIVWFFLLSYLVVVFYEYFFDHSTHRLAGKRMRLLYSLAAVSTVLFFLPLALGLDLPRINYFYLKLGLLCGVVPLIAFVIEAPRFIGIFLKTVPYFALLAAMDEVIGLHNGHWIYPGTHFIGWVHLASFTFPAEEIIFWMALFSSIVIAYFEFFDDNRLRFKKIRF